MNSDSDLTDLSSELSSVRSSLSPPPCFSYPSPQSSQDNRASVSDSQTGARKRSLSPSEFPPAKKRRNAEATPRTTAHLDLRSPPSEPAIDQGAQLNLLLKTLRKRRKIVVVAGAGISTAAGVPDFRSSNGLFNTLKSENKLKASGKHLFDASVYQTDDSTTSFHEMVRTLSKLVSDAKPTAFHEMLATLASEGRLLRLYTQNVDGIDTSLPPLATSIPLERKAPWPRTIQLHGSLEKMVCSKCNTLKNFDPVLFDGPIPPLCAVCEDLDKIRTENAGKRSHGIGRLRPRMVLYNESNPDDEAIGMVVKADLRARPDAIIVVGTSMEIPGVKRIVREMCGVVRGRKDGVAVWINRGPPPIAREFEGCWDLIVAGDCDKVAHRANMRRWNDEGNDYKDCTETEAERAKQKDIQVKILVKGARSKSSTPEVVKTPQRSDTPALMITPTESPKSKATKLPKIPLQLSQIDGKTKSFNRPSQKKVNKKTNSKASISKIMTAKSSRPASQINIKASFKITKSQSAPIPTPPAPDGIKSDSGVKIIKPRHPSPTDQKKARELLEGIGEKVAIAPLSPNSAKTNVSLSPKEVDNLLQPDVIRGIVLPLKDRSKQLGDETISILSDAETPLPKITKILQP